jgi:hypothetical protein
MLSGCVFNGGTYQIVGEKLGPGHCRQAGIVEFSIKAFRGPPNATLSLEIRNLKTEILDGIGGLAILDDKKSNEVGYKYYQIYYGTSPLTFRGRLAPGENVTVVYSLPSFPESPWRKMAIDYNQKGPGAPATPATQYCSLTGDNAPWAFETKP